MREPEEDRLRLRATVIGGDSAPDDYQVYWRDLSVGRILRQPGIPAGRPNWFWGVAFPGRPQSPGHRGNCSDLAECQRRFKAVWAGVRAALTEDDIDTARRVLEAAERRSTKWPGR